MQVFRPITIVSFCLTYCAKQSLLIFLSFLGQLPCSASQCKSSPSIFRIFFSPASCFKYSNPSSLQTAILLLQEHILEIYKKSPKKFHFGDLQEFFLLFFHIFVCPTSSVQVFQPFMIVISCCCLLASALCIVQSSTNRELHKIKITFHSSRSFFLDSFIHVFGYVSSPCQDYQN